MVLSRVVFLLCASFWSVRSQGLTCQDIDPDMTSCEDDPSSCCFEQPNGLNLNSVPTLRAHQSVVFPRLGKWRTFPQAERLGKTNPDIAWLKEQTYKKVKEELVLFACNCAGGQCFCGANDENDCCGDEEPQQFLPKPFNPGSPYFSPQGVNALENYFNYVRTRLVCEKCHKYFSASDGIGTYAFSHENPCDQYSGAKCLVSCVNSKTFQATCDCDVGWRVGTSGEDELKSYCRDGCGKASGNCDSDGTWYLDGLAYIRAEDCEGDRCSAQCIHGGTNGNPLAICACDDKWYVRNSGCSTCPSTSVRCSSTPQWIRDDAVQAHGSCSSTRPGDVCTVLCEAQQSRSVVATCRCNGKWNAPISDTCPKASTTTGSTPRPTPSPLPPPGLSSSSTTPSEGKRIVPSGTPAIRFLYLMFLPCLFIQ